MTKKLLLVGTINGALKSVHECLEEQYQVQICSPVYENVVGMMKIIVPDLVVTVVQDYERQDREIEQYLSSSWENTPVLVICTEEEYQDIRMFCAPPQFSFLFRPIRNSALLESCENALAQKDRFAQNSKAGTVDINLAADIASQFAQQFALKQEEVVNPRTQILVVDDSPLILRNIKSMLEDTFDVMLATSGEKALELVERYQIDLILLDYEMPEMNGLDVFKILKSSEQSSRIPVLFLTGVADKERFMEVLNLHPEGYILKPLDENKIMPAIYEALFASET